MYENINLISAETARQRSRDAYIRNRNEEISQIMDEVLDCANSGKKFLKTYVKYDSTVDKLLELGYVLSSTETVESYLKDRLYKECILITEVKQIIISWQ